VSKYGIVPADTCLISVEFPSWLNKQHPSPSTTVLNYFQHTDYCNTKWLLFVRDFLLGMFCIVWSYYPNIFLMKHSKILILLCSTVQDVFNHTSNATSTAKTQRMKHISYSPTLLLNYEQGITWPFEAPETASHPIRTEKSTTPLTEPEITQQ
jgi:hypothetical protein